VIPVYLQDPATLRIVFRRTPQTRRRMAAVLDAVWHDAGRCWFAPLESLGALLEQFPQARYEWNIFRALGPERVEALQAERAAKFGGTNQGATAMNEQQEQLDWNEAKKYLDTAERVYREIGAEGRFGLALTIMPLQDRYARGERTQWLYDDIMAVEI
jgi:hypothetical protein